MDSEASSYYPPRAGQRILPHRLALALERLAVRFRRVLRRLPGVSFAVTLTGEQLLLSFLIPGYAYTVLGRRRLAQGLAGLWLVSGLMLLILLGHEWTAGWALGSMVSAHTSGLGMLLLREWERNPEAPAISWKHRLAVPLVAWSACAALVYWPAYNGFQRFVAKPVRVNGRLYVINPRANREEVKRGTVIAYKFHGWRAGEMVMEDGLGVGEVIGMPGDRLEFGPASLVVNGDAPRQPESSMPQAADRLAARPTWQPFMPQEGEVVVPAEGWFVWPRLGAWVHGVDPAVVRQMYLREAQVLQADYLGRPFKRWFFHRQDTP
jgi:hypothetical protein